MKKILLLISFFCVDQFSVAQVPDEQILKPIENLFRAMETSDTVLLRKAFHTDVALVTITVDPGGGISAIRRESSIENFLRSIGKQKTEQFHEPIYNVDIKQEGNFAQVWASYAFFLGKNFHHCGIDTFQLLKTNDGWKIFYLADTRQTKDCIVPDEVRRKYGN